VSGEHHDVDRQRVERVELTLYEGEPISGQIGAEGVHPEPFIGWLELASKLEEIRAEHPGPALPGTQALKQE
jgi:hypothetical protein